MVKFWEDQWLEHGILQERFLRLYQVTSQRRHIVYDVGDWDGESWTWNLRWRRPWYDWEM